jgi:hypothetical protein
MAINRQVWGIFIITLLLCPCIWSEDDLVPNKSSESTIKNKWYIGQWDTTINSISDHPKTVILRIEVVDKYTRLAVPNTQISFKGEYWVGPTTSRDPDGEKEAHIVEYINTCKTDSMGIAVGAFNWQKEYPWSFGVDDIEKVQRIELRHPNYNYVEINTPFKVLIDIGQKRTKPYPTNDDTYQTQHVFNDFETTWKKECSDRKARYIFFNVGINYKYYDKTNYSTIDFFDNVRNKTWVSVAEETQTNMYKWSGGKKRSYCGPYFVYCIDVQLEQTSRHGQVRNDYTDSVDNPASKPSSDEKQSSNGHDSSSIKSSEEAINIISNNVDARNKILDWNNKEDKTEIYWHDMSHNQAQYCITIPKSTEVDGYFMGFSSSGNIVKISHNNPKPSKLIVFTPRNSKLQLEEDTYPTTVNLYATSPDAAKEIVKALTYLCDLD